jgi:hypothetical protein
MRSSHKIKKLKITRDTRRYSASVGVMHSVGDGVKAWSAAMVVVVEGPVSDTRIVRVKMAGSAKFLTYLHPIILAGDC